MSSVMGHTNGSAPTSRSSAVYTPITPGMDFAADVSMESIFAWTNGGRTMAIHTMPGAVMLSTKLACPVMSWGSSLRRTACPMKRSATAIDEPLSDLSAGHGSGGVEDRLHDVLVPGAPAEGSFERLAHILLCRGRVLLQEAIGGPDHPGGAI